MGDYIYFDKSHKEYNFIINLIIEKCEKIKNSINKLEYGYMHIQEEIGYSFVICSKIMDIPFIKLICARPNTKDGTKLIQLVEEKSIKDGYKYIALHSIIETNLINWYKKQGFIIENEIVIDYYDKKKPRVYLMAKKLV